MFHIKIAELFREGKLPDVNKGFVTHKCGSPDNKSRFTVRDTRASTMMAQQEQKTSNNGRVSMLEFLKLLKGIYDSDGIGGVQIILTRYKKNHLMKDFIAYLIRENF